MLKFLSLLSLFAVCNFRGAEAKIEFVIPTQKMTPSPPVESKFKCTCTGVDRDVMICANNGITYTSSCKFTCDQRQNPRLAITKEGTCAGVTLEMHQAASRKPEIH